MIFIFENDNIVGTLSKDINDPLITPYFEDTYFQDTYSGAETFEFSTFANSEFAKYLENNNYVGFINKGKFKLFQITDVESDHAETFIKKVYAETAGIELINEPVRPRVFNSVNVSQFMESILQDTEWELGFCDDSIIDIFSVSITENLEVYPTIQKYLRELWDAEFEFRIEIENNRIYKKYIDVIKSIGTNKGFRFSYGENVTGVKKKENSMNLVTALIGEGENGVTMADYSAPDKPLGQDFIGDNEALKRWSKKGKHITGIYRCNATNAADVYKLTKAELKRRVNPELTYEIKVSMLESEIENGDIEKGDTVYIIDTEYDPPLYLSARVSKLWTSFSDSERNECELSNFKEVKPRISVEMRRAVNAATDGIKGSIAENAENINTIKENVTQSGATNELYNSIFAFGKDKWNFWSEAGQAGWELITTSPTEWIKPGFKGGVRLTGSTADNRVVYQNIAAKLYPGTVFSVSYWGTLSGYSPGNEDSKAHANISVVYEDDTISYFDFKGNESELTKKWTYNACTFKIPEGKQIKEVRINFQIKKCTGDFYITEPMFVIGPATAWTPHRSEIKEGDVSISGSGILVKNAAIAIENGKGQKVFFADDNGTLQLATGITIGGGKGNEGTFQVLASNGDQIVNANKNGLFVSGAKLKVTNGSINDNGINHYPEGDQRDLTASGTGTLVKRLYMVGSQITTWEGRFYSDKMQLIEDNTQNAEGTKYTTTISAQLVNTPAVKTKEINFSNDDTITYNDTDNKFIFKFDGGGVGKEFYIGIDGLKGGDTTSETCQTILTSPDRGHWLRLKNDGSATWAGKPITLSADTVNVNEYNINNNSIDTLEILKNTQVYNFVTDDSIIPRMGLMANSVPALLQENNQVDINAATGVLWDICKQQQNSIENLLSRVEALENIVSEQVRR